jgi:hypothetical protein
MLYNVSREKEIIDSYVKDGEEDACLLERGGES